MENILQYKREDQIIGRGEKNEKKNNPNIIGTYAYITYLHSH